MAEPLYRRVVVKLSGEYLAGSQGFGFDQATVDRIAGDLIAAREIGTEIAVAVVDTGDGPQALIPVEIEPSAGVYGFQARYNAGETTFYAPSRLSDDVAAAVSDAAVLAHRTLGLRDLSRVDFIVDAGGTPWFLEANVIPGLTETSLLPLAIEASGTDAATIYSGLVKAAAARAAVWPRGRRRSGEARRRTL